MEMCYDEALVMPSSYAVMDEEEMTYVEGGYTIAQSRAYLDKGFCSKTAIKLKAKLGWNNISSYDLAAEIYSHAKAFYEAGPLLAMAAGLGIESAVSYLQSLSEIDVENARDSRYWMAFNVIYAVL